MPMIESLDDFSKKALMDLEQWLEPWFKASRKGAGDGLQFHDGTYGPLNVGDWLSVKTTGIGPSFFPVVFDVSEVGAGNNNGGFAIVAQDAGAATETGLTLNVQSGDASTMFGKQETFVTGDNSTGYGTFESLTVGANASAYETFATVHATGDGSSAVGYHVECDVQDAGSAEALHGKATARVGSFAYGVTAFATAVDGDSVGVSGTATTTGAGTPYAAQFGPGNFQVQLNAGQTLTVLDHLFNPIFRVDEDGDLHGLTGKALVFDL